MPALLTQRDRAIHRLQIEIQRHERWLHDECSDRRAAGFHRAKIDQLCAELNLLLERD